MAKKAEQTQPEKQPGVGIIGTVKREYNNSSPLTKLVLGVLGVVVMIKSITWGPVLDLFIWAVCIPFAMLAFIGATLQGSFGLAGKHLGGFLEEIGNSARNKIDEALIG